MSGFFSRARVCAAVAVVLSCGETVEPPGPPAKLGFASSLSGGTAGTALSFSVEVQDAQGRLVTSATDNVTIAFQGSTGTGAVLEGTLTRAAVGGVATFSDIVIKTARTGFVLTASATGLTDAASTTFAITHAAATKLLFMTQPGTATAATAFAQNVLVGVFDQFDNTASNSSVPVSLAIGTNPASGTLAGTTTVAAVNGVASFTGISINKSAPGYTLTASTPNLTSATSSTFVVNGGAATKIVFLTQPSAVTAGAAFAPGIQAAFQDAQGNVANTTIGSITLAMGYNAGLGTLSGTLTKTAVDGIATFSDASIDRAASSYTLIITSGTSYDAVLSSPFTVTPAAPAKVLVGVTPASARALEGMAFVVYVQDAFGNTNTSATNKVTLAMGTNPASGTLSGTVSRDAVNGLATFSGVKIDKVGTAYTLVAASAGLSSDTSDTFNITQGEPAQITFIQQPSSTAVAGIALPAFKAAVVDSGGNPVTDRAVQLSVVAGTSTHGASVATIPLFANQFVNAVNGVVTFEGIKLDRPGTYSLKITYNMSGSAFEKTSDSITVAQEFSRVVAGGGPAASAVGPDRHACSISVAKVLHCWGFSVIGARGIDTQLADAATVVTRPSLVTTDLLFSDLASGQRHACGITTAGAAYCWGSDTMGSLGDGAGGGTKDKPSAVSGGLTFIAITAGYNHTCGITAASTSATSGAVYCWGDNQYGQVGLAGAASYSTPVAVSGGLTFIAVSATHGDHTCGITTDFNTYCWGKNDHGQLGDNSTSPRDAPVQVQNSGTHLFRSIATGLQHTCAIRENGATYCWGANDSQQIGDGNTATTDRTSPSLISGTYSAISAGWTHSCAIGSGTAHCWGGNATGQLGDGGTTTRNAAAPVSGSLAFTQVTAGRDFSCGVTSGRKAYCWGANESSQLGDGTTTQRLTPVQIFP